MVDGGFSHLDHPQLVLEYHCGRKWILLHVLLGGDCMARKMALHPIICSWTCSYWIQAERDGRISSTLWHSCITGERQILFLLATTSHTKNNQSNLLSWTDTMQQTTANAANYQGLFQPKPNSPCIKFGWYFDGGALFWNSQKFKIIVHPQRQQYSNLVQMPCSSATMGDSETPWVEMRSFAAKIPCHNIPLHDPACNTTRNQIYIIFHYNSQYLQK